MTMRDVIIGCKDNNGEDGCDNDESNGCNIRADDINEDQIDNIVIIKKIYKREREGGG